MKHAPERKAFRKEKSSKNNIIKHSHTPQKRHWFSTKAKFFPLKTRIKITTKKSVTKSCSPLNPSSFQDPVTHPPPPQGPNFGNIPPKEALSQKENHPPHSRAPSRISHHGGRLWVGGIDNFHRLGPAAKWESVTYRVTNSPG